MELAHVDYRRVDRMPPPNWKKMWYGYFQMTKVQSKEKIENDKKTHKVSSAPGLKGEGYIELQVFLNLVKSLKGHVNFLELGAGRGDWCMALAGTVDFNLIDHEITSYQCVGVEAEPTHYDWMKTHFEEQEINAISVYGAISPYDGECQFYSVVDPASNYGQSVRDDGNITVPCYTVDTLISKYGLDKVDIMHVDVQGAEYGMFQGMENTLKTGSVKYMIIGTHKPEFNNKIIKCVRPYGYRSLFSVECHGGQCSSPFGDVLFPVDGLLVLEKC